MVPLTMSPSTTRLAEALHSTRRVYDTQIDEMRKLDEKAMRTTRTAFIMLGIIGAALTAAGPTFAAQLHAITLFMGALGTLMLFGSVLLGFAVFTLTNFPHELPQGVVNTALRTERDTDWIRGAVAAVNDTREPIHKELKKNTTYFEYSLGLFGTGVTLIAVSVLLMVVNNSFSIPPSTTLTATLGGSIVVYLGTRVIMETNVGLPR